MTRARVVTAVVSLTALACIRDTSVPVEPGLPRVAAAVSAAPGTPIGIGGSYTITAGGDYVKAIDPAATGVQVPEGVPVRVTISGAISVTPTAGLLAFCQTEYFYPLCTGQWADLINLRTIPPSGAGIDWWPGTGNILVSWNGGSSAKPDAGGNSVLSGPAPAEAEVWAGREQFGCWYDDDITHTGSGACFNYGGGFTVTVQANDGSEPGGGGGGGSDPKLRVSVDPQGVPAQGGVVTASALIPDGSEITDERWYFVPDSIGTQPGDTITVPDPATTSAAIESPSAVGAQPQAAASVLSSVSTARPSAEQEFRTVAAPLRIFHVIGAAPVGSVSGCDDVESCAVPVPRGGTVVVAATVDGSSLSASKHIDAGGAQAATLKLECPGSVTRGNTATCIASVDPQETPFTVTRWSFTPSSGDLPEIVRGGDQSSTEWSGHMATSGTVHVTATVGGATQEKSAAIHVDARALTTLAVALEITRSDPGDLPPHPTKVQELGHTYYEPEVNATNTFEVISDGPNAGLTFFTAVPVTMKITVSVNTAALAVRSDFYHLQNPPSNAIIIGTGPCTQQDVTRVIPQIEAHEGTSRTTPNSHIKAFMDLFEPESRAFFEPIVAVGVPPGPLDDLQRISTHAATVSGPQVDKSFANPFNINCTFKYF